MDPHSCVYNCQYSVFNILLQILWFFKKICSEHLLLDNDEKRVFKKLAKRMNWYVELIFIFLIKLDWTDVCICVCMYVCIYLCMYVCMYVFIHVCRYVCIYVCICHSVAHLVSWSVGLLVGQLGGWVGGQADS